MTAITATGDRTVIAEFFEAVGEVDQTEGRGGTRVVGAFTELDEAVAASHRQGVQGTDGYVDKVTWVRHGGGAVTKESLPVRARTRLENRFYGVAYIGAWEHLNPPGHGPWKETP